MPRIIIPAAYDAQRKLFSAISAKVSADGPGSVLTPFMQQHNISLPADAGAGAQADIADTSRALFSKNAQNYRQLRDTSFAPVWAHLRKGAQTLKSFYTNNTKALGDWGITVVGEGKLSLPTDFEGQLKLFRLFAAKHASYPNDSSPLAAFFVAQGISIAADEAAADAAESANRSMAGAAEAMEKQTEARDLAWDPVMAHVRDMIGFLKNFYAGKEKTLGDYGIGVDASPQAPTLRKTSLKLSEGITITNATIGGTFTNTGGTDLHLYRGKTTTGTPTIIHPGEKLGIAKGWSILTVVNASALDGGKFTVTVSSN